MTASLPDFILLLMGLVAVMAAVLAHGDDTR